MQHLIQSSIIKQKRLVPVPGGQEVAPTESSAIKKAEAMAKRIPGTAAIRIMADDETQELESATILGQFGEVPKNFADRLAAV